MATDRHLGWSALAGFAEDAAPSAHALSGTPALEIVIGEGGDHVGLRIPDDGTKPESAPLAEIDLDVIFINGVAYHEITTRNRDLYPYFYDLACSIADKIQLEGLPTASAFASAISDWAALLRHASGLTDEQQAGLLGELWVLNCLIPVLGSHALDAWIGPAGQAHDFRIADTEIEVKTTRMEQRIHTISSLGQLTPSPDAVLYLVSVQLAAAGSDAGFTLASQLETTREALVVHKRADDFVKLLEQSLHLRWADIHRYQRPLKLRSEPTVVEINGDFPRLSRADIDNLPRIETHRILDASYRLNVDGLGRSAKQLFVEIGPSA